MEAQKLNNLSIQDYIKIEKTTDTKYEYHNGTITAMAGGSLEHGLICGNVFGEIRTALRAKRSNCITMNSEIKLYIATQNRFLYPDTMVVCGDIEKSTDEKSAVTNPKIIIEVLSKSTASYDRGDKFFFYRQIESLEEYILIEQEKAQIEVFKRQAKLWSITRITGIDKTLSIGALNISIDLKEIYEGIFY